MPTNDEIAGWLEESADDVCGWAAYADVYYRTKHDLEGDVARIRTRATAVRKMPEQAELLAALKDLLGWFPAGPWLTDEPAKATARARAAIKKATP